ncbi:uncharacterized protein LOC116344877 isoform X2 [Contarinia nasturtii]|uniref:uncharacterized protein LOC116344877 isoform X2 n=1 Tax=Contarinia nasturtii TaxID=265458 RepID=UPI0012D3A822|nr:uncharacterized protein LOC116344877 isoform X2 [Contarinia nasturtii]XP_031629576.1 uncharacterized protein LOC116344877 isoform X2 [Contarinia nasturtii]
MTTIALNICLLSVINLLIVIESTSSMENSTIVFDFKNDNYEEITLCETYEDIIYPTIGKTSAGVDMLIVNTPEHRQGIRISMCQNIGQPCNNLNNFVPSGYVTACKQQYTYRELVSLGANNQIIKDKFEFPSSCSCALYRIRN